LTHPADGNAYNAHDEEINLLGEQYRAYKDLLTEEEKKSLLEDLTESKNIKEHGVRVTNKAVALATMQTTSQIGKVVHFLKIIVIHATALTVILL
jgi:cytochrome c-type biogenesis protein CcmH/NrfG